MELLICKQKQLFFEMRLSERIRFAAVQSILMLMIGTLFSTQLMAHEDHFKQTEVSSEPSVNSTNVDQATEWFRFLSRCVEHWPSPITPELIRQAYSEHQVIHGSDIPVDTNKLEHSRNQILSLLEERIPTVKIEWLPTDSIANTLPSELEICSGMSHPLLVTVRNRTDEDIKLDPTLSFFNPDLRQPHESVFVAAQSSLPVLFEVSLPTNSNPGAKIEISFRNIRDNSTKQQESADRTLSIPIRTVRPGILRASIVDEKRDEVASRVTVQCSDGVCRYGGAFASKSTFTDKPIIYPPIGTWQKTPFFYSDGEFEMLVPPGKTVVTIERGFEHERRAAEIDVVAGETHTLELPCERAVDLASQGWVSGDTHVHWVTNQWNVDEPLELLSLAQRAEDLRVANNLTLLQRYANQAFIKPSQAQMGPVEKFSDSEFHVQMGEEYRNEDLYGHLCFLNIDWLVQPIGTGSIIAGPDALDYPVNRTAIEACRDQGGISIEAHGTGGNKDVPVNVVHNLADSLDQMEPEMYYRLLDCGFQIPLTNGSDHPARTLGIARAYIKIDGAFTYDRWIEGIRRGRTFTTSGPLIFLTVNDASIGDVIHTGATENLRIQAKVHSRDPIGKFQIVSNGKIVAEKIVAGTFAEIELDFPVQESRWIVARCSNRTGGREDFGFGDFNAITGPGVAHTSPVYVQVDGTPRFNSAAADYWADRMRLHALEMKAKGRFANAAQRDEAVNYIQQGIMMFLGMEQQIRSARSREESLDEAKARISNVVRRFGNSPEIAEVLDAISSSDSRRSLSTALEPITLLSASVNPESRVKISARRDKFELHEGRPQRFLIRIENTAGVTAPLGIQAIDVTSDPIRAAGWVEIRVIDSPFSSAYCTGAVLEFKVVEILAREPGLREVRLVADVGQGTQDLGFRATADVLIDTKPRAANDAKGN